MEDLGPSRGGNLIKSVRKVPELLFFVLSTIDQKLELHTNWCRRWCDVWDSEIAACCRAL